MVDVVTLVFYHQVGQMQNQFFLRFVLPDHDAPAKITQLRFLASREGQHPGPPMSDSFRLSSADVYDLIGNQSLDFVLKLSHGLGSDDYVVNNNLKHESKSQFDSLPLTNFESAMLVILLPRINSDFPVRWSVGHFLDISWFVAF